MGDLVRRIAAQAHRRRLPAYKCLHSRVVVDRVLSPVLWGETDRLRGRRQPDQGLCRVWGPVRSH